jgi:hypothetical protein
MSQKLSDTLILQGQEEVKDEQTTTEEETYDAFGLFLMIHHILYLH